MWTGDAIFFRLKLLKTFTQPSKRAFKRKVLYSQNEEVRFSIDENVCDVTTRAHALCNFTARLKCFGEKARQSAVNGTPSRVSILSGSLAKDCLYSVKILMI